MAKTLSTIANVPIRKTVGLNDISSFEKVLDVNVNVTSLKVIYNENRFSLNSYISFLTYKNEKKSIPYIFLTTHSDAIPVQNSVLFTITDTVTYPVCYVIRDNNKI